MATATKPGTAVIVVPIELRIAAESIENLVGTALGSGVSVEYWCTDARARKPYAIPDAPDNLGANLAAGGVIELLEGYDEINKWHVLSLKKLKKGIALWVQGGYAGGDYMHGEKDGVQELDIDGPQADVIIQFALFGEQRYG